MSDKLDQRSVGGNGYVEAKYVDMGDGSWAEAVVASGVGFKSAPTVTRPANTTAYTAGDVIGGAIELTSIGPIGAHVLITGVDLRIDVASLPSGMGNMRMQIYDATPPSALADNAAWSLPSGDRANYLGYIDIGTPVAVGSTLFVQADGVNKQFKLGAGQTSLWAYLMTTAGFTPGANSEVYNPRARSVSV
jgi:hypothetical protein